MSTYESHAALIRNYISPIIGDMKLDDISTIAFEGKSLAVSMTFGVSAIREGQTVEQLIAEADSRLYQGKEQGRNCVIETDLMQ